LTSKAEFVSKARLGETVTLKWKIKNNSKKPWPAHPLLHNFSDDMITMDKTIDTILGPCQDYEITYTLQMPIDFVEKFFALNLHLVDPIKKERFGDAMIAIIEVEPSE
jgi:hypothetical protein